MKVPMQFTDPDYNPYAKWRVKYLLPVYLVVTVVLLGGFILAALPDDEPGVFGIVCLILWVVATVAVLLAVPFCRKKEIPWELRQYDFDWQRCPEEKVYFYQGNNFYVRFLPEVMGFDDRTQGNTPVTIIAQALERAFPALYAHVEPLISQERAEAARQEIARQKQVRSAKRTKEAESSTQEKAENQNEVQDDTL